MITISLDLVSAMFSTILNWEEKNLLLYVTWILFSFEPLRCDVVGDDRGFILYKTFHILPATYKSEI